jgi:hypothetical protein
MPDDPDILLARNYQLQNDLDAANAANAALAGQVKSLQDQVAALTAGRDAALAQVQALTPPAGTAAIQSKWDRILGPGGILADFTVVHLDDPVLVAMANAAVADGILTADEKTAVLATS